MPCLLNTKNIWCFSKRCFFHPKITAFLVFCAFFLLVAWGGGKNSARNRPQNQAVCFNLFSPRNIVQKSDKINHFSQSRVRDSKPLAKRWWHFVSQKTGKTLGWFFPCKKGFDMVQHLVQKILHCFLVCKYRTHYSKKDATFDPFIRILGWRKNKKKNKAYQVCLQHSNRDMFFITESSKFIPKKSTTGPGLCFTLG